MRDKVTFPTNVPTHVILEGIGAEQMNRAGDPEFRYFLRGEKVMWVPPEVHGALEQMRANNGTEVMITKQQAKRGAPVRWTVEQIAEEPTAAAELRNTATAPSSRAQQPRAAGDYERQPGQGWTYREPAQPTRNGHQPPPQPAPRPAPTPAPQRQQGPEVWYEEPQQLTAADKLAGCLAAAIDAAAEAAIYAERHGLTLHWDAGDIRAMAATLMIGEQRQGRM